MNTIYQLQLTLKVDCILFFSSLKKQTTLRLLKCFLKTFAHHFNQGDLDELLSDAWNLKSLA